MRARATTGRRRLETGWIGAALVVVLLALAGCGIPTDGEPRVITDESTTTAAPATSGGSGSSATIFLTSPAGDDPEDQVTLVGVTRRLDGPPTPETVLDAVLAPTTQQDATRGYQSLIPPDTTLESLDLEDGVLTVELSEQWSDLKRPEALQGYAQVVLSVTELGEVSGVRFAVDGEVLQAPTPSGDEQVVTARDYDDLARTGG